MLRRRKKRAIISYNPRRIASYSPRRVWKTLARGLGRLTKNSEGFVRRPRHNGGYGYHHYPAYIQVEKKRVLPPLIPKNVAQPGEPGGGDFPQNGDPEVLGLVPRGLRPVAVFPPYLFPRTVPAKCVIWAEPDPVFLRLEPPPSPKLSFLDRIRSFFGLRRRHRVARNASAYKKYKPKKYPKKVRIEEVPAFERRYGFRCKITLVDRLQCQLGLTCDADGNRLAQSRQTGEEFFADGPPECRTELSPLGCRPFVK